MRHEALSREQKSTIKHQVADMLGKSKSFRSLPSDERHEIYKNTTDLVSFLSAHDPDNPLVESMAGVQRITPARPDSSRAPQQARQRVGYKVSSRDQGDKEFKAQAMREGIHGVSTLIDEVDFPGFVAELIRGTFQAIVDSSIQQMRAYGELAQSIAMSLNEFRDENVTKNQARDSLMQKYPDLFQLKIEDDQPQLTTRPGAGFGELPDFKNELGLDDEIDDLDDEIIEQKLVPAAQTNLARSRQRLLATMVLMGINRIIVTDGQINAKVKFNFSAADRMQSYAQNYDWANMGVNISERAVSEKDEKAADVGFASGKISSITGAKRYTTDAYRYDERPIIRLSSMSNTKSEGEIMAAGQMAGSVKIKFKSETFPLEKMLDSDQVMKLQSAGRAAPLPLTQQSTAVQNPQTAPQKATE